MTTTHTILQVLVGSRAHGLARADSDWDYRAVFVHPTRSLLALGPRPKDTNWVEGMQAGTEKVDDTSWELGHFLSLATKCNPTILEVFTAPAAHVTPLGLSLRGLFESVWHPSGVRDAFTGYAHNQQKKMLADHASDRWRKFACAYLRVLYQGTALLRTGILPVDMTGTEVYEDLSMWRDPSTPVSHGQVIDRCAAMRADLESAFALCTHTPDLGRVNEWLLHVRGEMW